MKKDERGRARDNLAKMRQRKGRKDRTRATTKRKKVLIHIPG